MIRPGEIYLADFEEMEPHPVVVAAREHDGLGLRANMMLIGDAMKAIDTRWTLGSTGA